MKSAAQDHDALVDALYETARKFTLVDAEVARLRNEIRELGERIVLEHGKGNIEFGAGNALAAMVEKALNGKSAASVHP